MSATEVMRWAIDIAAWFAVIVVPNIDAVRRRVLTTQRRIDVFYGLGCGLFGVEAFDTAHRLVHGQSVVAYAYLVGVPGGLILMQFLGVRLGLWAQPSVRVRRSCIPSKSRASA